MDIHGIDFGIVGVEVFFCFQRTGQPLFLPLIIVLKFTVIPVILKGGSDLVNGFGQVAFRYLGVPFKATGQRRIGQIGRAHIGRHKASVTVEDIRLGMEACCLGIVADLDLRIGQLAKFLDGFHIRCAHVRSGDNAKFAAVLRKLPQLVHNEPQAAPFDEGHQHVNSVGRDDLFLELCEHLRLMHCAGE